MQNRRSFLKKSGLLLAAGALLLSAFSFSKKRIAQEENIEVILYVDTSTIDKPDVNASCSFGQPPEIPNEEFTIEARIGDTITWRGVSTNAPDTDVVNIKSINHEGGKNVFSKNVLIGDRGTPEKVVGKVVTNSVDGNKDSYKYKISFTVENNGVQRNGTFHIDPKIRVH